MQTASDFDGTQGRRASNGRALTNVADRSKSVRRAKRHSRLVRVLRIALPLGAVAIAGYYASTMIEVSGIGSKIVRTALPKIVPASLTMNNPRYRGFTKDGGAYVVEAKTARQSPKNTNQIDLDQVSGLLTQANQATTNLSATTGAYFIDSEQIELHTQVRIKSSNGGWAELESLRVDPKTGLMTSAQPVKVGNPTATISANALEIKQKSKEIIFTGKVATRLTPSAGMTATATAPRTGGTPAAIANGASGATAMRLFSSSKGPIDIDSDRLDIDDIKKTAIFIGNVRVTQGDVTMTTPELRVAYDGAPSAGLAGSADAGAVQPASASATGVGQGAAKITSIVAAPPVDITQAPATRITGQTASFDATGQRATLEGGVVITRAPDTRITGQTAGFDDTKDTATLDGDVVLTQGADRRATGDHAEFHNTAQTALLTGNVVLNQGQNVLRGKRLFLDQRAGRSELTAPPAGNAAPGRIAAHFVQSAARTGAKPTAVAAAQDSTAGGGFTGMSSFRTDPNAPVDIAADQLEMIDAKKIAVFRGDVHAQQGDFKVRTAELTAHYSGSAGLGNLAGAQPEAGGDAATERVPQPAAKLIRLKASGKVVVTSKNGQSATGDWADFDVPANTVTLGGEVVLSQARNVVRGTRLLIDLTSGESVIKSDNAAAPQVAAEKPGSGWQAHQQPARPSAIFYPQQLKEKAAAAAAAATGVKAKKPGTPAAGVSSWQSTTMQPAPPTRGN